MTVSSEISNRISLMKLICAFMVVVVHSQLPAVNVENRWVREFLMYGVCRIAVPFFFAMAGLFLAKHMGEKGWYKSAIVTRIKTIIVPYFAATVCFMALVYGVLTIMGKHFISTYGFLTDLGVNPLDVPLLVPFWYLRALFILVLVSPVLYTLIIRSRKAVAVSSLVFIALMCFVIRPFSDCSTTQLYLFLNYGFSLEGLLYFSLGMFLYKYPIPLPSPCWGGGAISVGVALFALRAFLLIHTNHAWNAAQIGFIAIPITIVGMFSCLPSWKLPTFLASASFPVYVLHLFVLFFIGGRWSHHGELLFSPDASLLHWGFRIVVSILGALALYALLRRFVPRFSRVLFGGR